MVGQPGFEPGTSVLSGLRSNQLSYWPFADHSTRIAPSPKDGGRAGRIGDARLQGVARGGAERRTGAWVPATRVHTGTTAGRYADAPHPLPPATRPTPGASRSAPTRCAFLSIGRGQRGLVGVGAGNARPHRRDGVALRRRPASPPPGDPPHPGRFPKRPYRCAFLSIGRGQRGLVGVGGRISDARLHRRDGGASHAGGALRRRPASPPPGDPPHPGRFPKRPYRCAFLSIGRGQRGLVDEGAGNARPHRHDGVALRRRPASPPPGDPPHPGRFPKRPYRCAFLSIGRGQRGLVDEGAGNARPHRHDGGALRRRPASPLPGDPPHPGRFPKRPYRRAFLSIGRGERGLVGVGAGNARPHRHDGGASHARRGATPSPRIPSPRRPAPPRALPEAPLQGAPSCPSAEGNEAWWTWVGAWAKRGYTGATAGRRTPGVALRRRPASPPPGDPPHPGRFPKRPYKVRLPVHRPRATRLGGRGCRQRASTPARRRGATPSPRIPSPRRPAPPRALPEAPLQVRLPVHRPRGTRLGGRGWAHGRCAATGAASGRLSILPGVARISRRGAGARGTRE